MTSVKKISLTSVDADDFELAVHLVDKLLTEKDHLRVSVGCVLDVGPKDVNDAMKILGVFRRVYDKEEKKEGRKKGKGETTRTNYLVKARQPTEKSKSLFSMIKTNIELRYDQVDETCPTDVDKLIREYVRQEKLVDDAEKRTRVDDFLRDLAPETFGGRTYYSRKDELSVVGKARTEILKGD